jgi:oligoribonuclease NrnB/cAMP/cGMP phosphodiesterase (DHH superfamily)
MQVDFSKLEVIPNEIDLVIYHGNCSDGFSSALAVYTYFKPTNGVNVNGKKVEYFSASFNQSPPDVTGKNVLICDFSYGESILQKMISKAKTLSIIDHHKTARKCLKNISCKNKYFNMNHSGASLTWAFMFPEQASNLPLFIRYVEDHDIWLHKIENSEAMAGYYYSLPFEFEEYEKLLDEKYIAEIMPVALGMKKQNDVYVKSAMSCATLKFYKIKGEYHLVAHVNSTVLKSEIGNNLLSKFPYCDLSAVYSLRDGITTFSLRSEDVKTDTTFIASKFGGGGHRNASGMAVNDSNEIPGKLIDENLTYKLLELNSVTIKPGELFARVETNFNVHQIGQYMLQNVYFEEREPIRKVLISNADIVTPISEPVSEPKKIEELTGEEKYDDELTPEEFNLKYRTVKKCCAVMRTKTSNPLFYVDCKACVVTSRSVDYLVTYSIFWLNNDVSNIVRNIFEKCKDFNMANDCKKATFVCSQYDIVDEKLNKFNYELGLLV